MSSTCSGCNVDKKDIKQIKKELAKLKDDALVEKRNLLEKFRDLSRVTGDRTEDIKYLERTIQGALDAYGSIHRNGRKYRKRSFGNGKKSSRRKKSKKSLKKIARSFKKFYS